MKKITFMLIAMIFAVAGFAQKPLAKAEVFSKTTNELRQTQMLAKGVARSTTTRQKAPRKSLGLVTPPTNAVAETYYIANGKFYVYSGGWKSVSIESIQVIVDGNDIYIAGLSYYAPNAWIKGTINGTTATFPKAQQVDDSESPEWISGSDDGSTICDLVFNFDQVDGRLECVTKNILDCASEDGTYIYAYWDEPYFSKRQRVVLPQDAEVSDYLITYVNDDSQETSAFMFVGIDGNDVYFQGLSSFLPEAWVKGTLKNGVVTIPGNQYLGIFTYYDGTRELFMQDRDYQFTYDAETGVFTGNGLLFFYSGDSYTDYYLNPVIAPVAAAMPANPEITSFEEQDDYGYFIEFNVPTTDTNGNQMSPFSLYYMIYTETEGKIEPLTFTPATHEYLTEDMTEIPYGFADNWDFNSNSLFFNELYSEDWNKIGIQSIYYGDGKRNATKIQWYVVNGVYSEFVEETGTLTYYCDDKFPERTGKKEAYDPVVDPDAVRFKDYNKKVTKIVIDPSMKNASLTSFKNFTFGGMDQTYSIYNLPNVTSIEGLKNLNTKVVTDMNSMFVMCESLKELDLSSFNTSKVTTMNGMFQGCSNLEMIDLSSFNVSKVKDMYMMFLGCNKLKTIYCNSDWNNTTATSDYMFYGCTSLVGGKGTPYSDTFVDKTYARRDGGPSAPGYFTIRIKGDADGDGQVTAADIVAMTKYMMGNMPAGFSKANADVNLDGVINIADIVAVSNILLND